MKRLLIVASLMCAAHSAHAPSARAQGMIEYGGATSVASGLSMPKLETFPANASAPQATSSASSGASMKGGVILSPAQREQMKKDLAAMNAAFAGETWNVRAALAKGADVNARDYQYGLTPLMWAATGGRVGTIRYLLERGAKVNAQSTVGVRVFMAQGRSVDTVTSVSDAGVSDVRHTSYLTSERGGVTALMMAAANGWNLAARELLKHGADPNLTTPDGDTALSAAAFSGSLPLVQALLDKGAKLNAVDHLNNTALFYAVIDGHTPVVRALLARGARVNIVSRQGNLTAAGLAHYRGFKSLAEMLDRAAKKEKPMLVPTRAKLPTKLPPPARDEVRILN